MKTLDYILFNLVSHWLAKPAFWSHDRSHCEHGACTPGAAVVFGPLTLCAALQFLFLRDPRSRLKPKPPESRPWLVCSEHPQSAGPALCPSLPCVLLSVHPSVPVSRTVRSWQVLSWFSTYQKGLLSVPGHPRNIANSRVMVAPKLKEPDWCEGHRKAVEWL